MHTCKQLRAGECGGAPPRFLLSGGLLSRALRGLKEARRAYRLAGFMVEKLGAREIRASFSD